MEHHGLSQTLTPSHLLSVIDTLRPLSTTPQSIHSLQTFVQSEACQSIFSDFQEAQFSLIVLGPTIEQDSTLVYTIYEKISEDIIATVSGLQEFINEVSGYDPLYRLEMETEMLKYRDEKYGLAEEKINQVQNWIQEKYDRVAKQDVYGLQSMMFGVITLIGDIYGQVVANEKEVERFLKRTKGHSFYK